MNTKRVSTKNELMARLISATSIEILAPIVRDKIVGNLSLSEGLQADLSEPVIVTSAERKFQQYIIGNELASIITELIRSQPALRDVSIKLFQNEVGPALQELQGTFLESCFLAVTLISHSNNDFEDNLDDIIRIAASATPAGRLMREFLTDFTHKPNPLDPPKGGLPGLPGISEQLLVKAEIFRKRGCVGAVKKFDETLGHRVEKCNSKLFKGCYRFT